MFKKLVASVISFFLLAILSTSSVLAESVDITISGNGSQSDNSASVSVSSSTTVSQSNSADIQNNVSSDSNSGGNETSSNFGEANINTGNAGSSTSISNQNINSNSVDGNCNCTGTNMNADITGNGSSSTNTLNLSAISNINLFQENNASIANNSSGYANTGYNLANSNNGDVSIITGNAGTYTTIKNKNININLSNYGGTFGDLLVSISGNGAGSINLSNIIFNSSFEYSSNNVIALFNNAINSANSGGNTANWNNGSVLIATGDAISVVDVANENINGSSVTFCPTKLDTSPPPAGGPPSDPPVSQPSNSTVVQSASQGSAGSAIGTVLPATGGYLLLLMTILCLTIFLAGGYLRFSSGISPPFAYAV